MCLGIPARVVECHPGYALCDIAGEQRHIDTLLTGDQPPGTWLMTFLGSAREVLDEASARRSLDALQALSLVMSSDVLEQSTLDSLFADLDQREPSLPDFLQQTPNDQPIKE